MSENKIDWRPLSDKEHDLEYQLACKRIGEYDGYIVSFNRVYITIVTAILVAQHYTNIPWWQLGFYATLALPLVYVAAMAVTSVKNSFINYCTDYWSSPKEGEDKVRQSLTEWMGRPSRASKDFCKTIKKFPRAGTLIPILVCWSIAWIGVSTIPKRDRWKPPESEVTRVMYSQKTAEGTREVEQVIKNTKPTTQPADK